MSYSDAANTFDASLLTDDMTLEADVVIIGTGAGGGMTAETLALAGLKVVMIEEGAHNRTRDFVQNEAHAVPHLYQQAGTQRTRDRAILVLQGRTVGGGTVVNWTSCFRTPEKTLAHWQEVHGIKGLGRNDLAPVFDDVAQRLNITPFTDHDPNRNNGLVADGCDRLGYHRARIARNVKGCADSGQCGMGCPLAAKQSQLVTTIPSAMQNGAQLVHRARVLRILHDGKRAQGVEAAAMDANGVFTTGHKVIIRARHVVLAAGAIQSPAILMRSEIPDLSGMTGKRTFLHPSVLAFAVFDEQVNGFYGAPQTVYSDHFLWPDDLAANGELGFKFEATPVLPITASTMGDKTMGPAHAELMRNLGRVQSIVALGRDGFNADEACGSVELASDGRAMLDYPVTDFLIKGHKAAIARVMELLFAAGARAVYPWHVKMPELTGMTKARAWLDTADMGPLQLTRASAHVMGGCQMGVDETRGVVDANARHFALENLSVHDGSIFPSSIGANPSLSIYATALRNARTLAATLT